MSKTLDKMLELRIERTLVHLNRAGALLMDMQEGRRRDLYHGASICELLSFARKYAGMAQTVLVRMESERVAARKAGCK